MKTYLSTCVFCLWSAMAMAQIGGNPAGERDATGEEPRGGLDRQRDAGAAAGPGEFRGPMGPPPNPMFAAIDTDGDGMISTRELRRAVVQLKKLDADRDGNLTLAEVSGPGGPGGQFAPWGDPAQMVDRMMESDKDGDGKLTANELPGQMAQQMIQNGDRDGDGALSKEELTQSMEEMRNRFRNGPGGFPVGPGGPGAFQGVPGAFQGVPGGVPGAAGAEQRQMIGRMMQWDRNGDGKLSPDEVPQQSRGMLSDADTNGDNFIDAAEMRAVIARMNERFPGGGRNFNGRAPRGRDAINDPAEDDDEEEAPDTRRGRRNP